MTKGIINIDGNDVVVREDTAKAYRFTVWGGTIAAICLALMVVLATIFFMQAGKDGRIESPAQIENKNTNASK